MSWLSSRSVGKQINSALLLEYLQASTIGLGNGDCIEQFPCDLNMVYNIRKSRRRKRSINNYKIEWNI